MGKNRLAYLDTLRGFTMLLVVWHHVADYSFNLKIEDSILMEIFISFRMPMFFFISGYIAYKELSYWTLNNTLSRTIKKAQVQLIPTLVFWFAGMILLFSVPIIEIPRMFTISFPGYWWFTVALFIMFISYYVANIIANYTHTHWLVFPLLISLIIIFALFKNVFQGQNIAEIFALPGVARFYMFFVFGLFIRSQQTRFFLILQNRWFVTGCIIVVCILTYLSYGASLNYSHNLRAFIRTIIGFPFVIVVFNAFYRLSEFWECDNWLSRSLRFIGRRTLDLYMLHFFFIPNMNYITPYIIGVNQAVPQFFVITLVTMGIVALCLAVSGTLRTSPILAKYLFGVSSK